MGTVTYEYTFDTGTQGLTLTSGVDAGLTWTGSIGNPAGSLELTGTNANGSSASAISALLGTWQDFGVPAGSVVLSAKVVSIDTYYTAYLTSNYVIDFVSGGSSVAGVPIASGLFSGSVPIWDTLLIYSSQDIETAFSASDTPVQFVIELSNITSQLSNIFFDNLLLEITYTGGEVVTVERATVYEGAQLGMEVTPGTSVAASRRLLCMEIDPDPKTDIKPVRPTMGFKAITGVTIGKEYSTAKMTGDLAYNDIVYQFSSLWSNAKAAATPSPIYTLTLGTQISGTFTLTYATKVTTAIPYSATANLIQAALEALSSITSGQVWVTGTGPFTIQFQFGLGIGATALTGIFTALSTPGNASITNVAAVLTKRWEFLPSYNQPDQYQTFTVEKGVFNAASAGSQMAFGTLVQMGFKITQTDLTIDGSWLGQTLVDPFTLTTAGVVEIPALPASPSQASVFIGSSTSSMVRLSSVIECDYSMSPRFKPKITVDESMPSFSTLVEVAPQPKIKLTVEHDTQAYSILSAMRAGSTQYIRIEFIGPSTEAGFNNRICFMAPLRVIQAPRADKDGVYCDDFDAEVAYDPTMGGWIFAECDNILSAL